jgi:hypothetical protein
VNFPANCIDYLLQEIILLVFKEFLSSMDRQSAVVTTTAKRTNWNQGLVYIKELQHEEPSVK